MKSSRSKKPVAAWTATGGVMAARIVGVLSNSRSVTTHYASLIQNMHATIWQVPYL